MEIPLGCLAGIASNSKVQHHRLSGAVEVLDL